MESMMWMFTGDGVKHTEKRTPEWYQKTLDRYREEGVRIATRQTKNEHTLTCLWTGSFPNLCRGEWLFLIDGIPYQVPFQYEPADTFGRYCRDYWDGKDEREDYYESGFGRDKWIKKYHKWLHSLPLAPAEYRDVYRVIRNQDWRYESCGGCV